MTDKIGRSRPIVYTTGYLAGWTPDALAAAVAEHGAVLCDIRFMPRSRVPGWNRAQLERLMGTRYRHLKALGNQNYRGGEIALVNLAGGLRQVETLLDEFGCVVLMCACRDRRRCHRRLVADEVRQQLEVATAELRPPPGSANEQQTNSKRKGRSKRAGQYDTGGKRPTE